MIARQSAVVLAVCVPLIAAGCSSSADEQTETVVVTETVEKTTPTPNPQSPRKNRERKRPSAPTRFSSYTGTYYTADLPDGWVLEEDEADHSGFVRSLWSDPSDASASILIDVIDGETTTAQEKATSVMAATSQSAGYEELSSGPATVAGLDGYKWVFTVSGDQRVDYFLNDCATGIAVLGSAAPSRFGALEATFERVAHSVLPSCATGPESPPEPDATACHPSYKGACLDSDAYDYDCEGGSGDGPMYTGFVTVTGPDDYELDNDGDGTGCEA